MPHRERTTPGDLPQAVRLTRLVRGRNQTKTTAHLLAVGNAGRIVQVSNHRLGSTERVSAKQAAHHRQLIEHLQQEVQRLDYEAKRAKRQHDLVNPENRLIAATLEKKWEHALEEREQVTQRLADASR